MAGTLKKIVRAMVPDRFKWRVNRFFAAVDRKHEIFRRRTKGLLFYRGHGVECPCCGAEYREFLPFGAYNEKKRPNAMCARCGSLERHRLVWLFLSKKAEFFSGEPTNLLHVAPEPSLAKRFAKMKNMRHVSMDMSMPAVSVKADLVKLPFASESFQWVFCSHVLEHIKDDAGALFEMRRVLLPGGKAVILVPIFRNVPATIEEEKPLTPDERARQFGQKDHVRIIGLDYGRRMEKAGFKVEAIRARDLCGDSEIKKYGLFPEEVIFVCSKVS